MPRRVPLPRELAIAPFRTREAGELGVPRKRLEASDINRPFHGVNSTSVPSGVRDRATAFLPLLREGDAFSHVTAAALLGAPLPRLRDPRLHVTSLGTGDRFRRRGIAGHTASAVPVIVHHGLPVIEPAHAWVQLATLLAHDDLVAVGDFLVTPRRSEREPAVSSIAALAAAIPAGGRGATRARRAHADVRIGPESRMETLLRLLLVRSGLPEPMTNPPVRVGSRVLHPDLLYPQWGVVLEYEGDGHRTDPRSWRRDIWRREAFQAAGYRVIQVHRDDVLAEPEAFLARVCRILAQRQRGISAR